MNNNHEKTNADDDEEATDGIAAAGDLQQTLPNPEETNRGKARNDGQNENKSGQSSQTRKSESQGVKLKMPSRKAGMLTTAFNRLWELKNKKDAKEIVLAAVEEVEREIKELELQLEEITPVNAEQEAFKDNWAREAMEKKKLFVKRVRANLEENGDQYDEAERSSLRSVSRRSMISTSSSLRRAAAEAEGEEAQLLAKQRQLKKLQDQRRRQEEEERRFRDQQEEAELVRQLEGIRAKRAALARSMSCAGSQADAFETEEDHGHEDRRNANPIGLPTLQQPSNEWLDSIPDMNNTNRSQGMRPGDQQEGQMTSELVQHVLLAQAKIPVFKGDVLEYLWFKQAFETQIARVTTDPARRLYLLLQQLEGAPLNLVRGCQLLDPAVGYNRAIVKLDNKYGSPICQALAFRARLLSWPKVRTAKELDEYSVQLQLCLDVKLAGSGLEELDAPATLLQLALKLPTKLQTSWQSKAYTFEAEQGRVAQFDDFVNFVERHASIRNHPVYRGLNGEHKEGKELATSENNRGKKDDRNEKRVFSTDTRLIQELEQSVSSNQTPSSQPQVSAKATISAAATKTTTAERRKESAQNAYSAPCLLCGGNHATESCFKANEMDARSKREKLQGLCFSCLKPGHRARFCKDRNTCRTCGGRHPTILHQERETDKKEVVSGDKEHNFCTADKNDGVHAVATVPVKVWLPGSVPKITRAVLDTASTATFITERLFQALGAGDGQSEVRDITLTTMTANASPVRVGLLSGLKLADMEQNNVLDAPPMYVVQSLPFGPSLSPECMERWPHLKDINLHWTQEPVGLLIGQSMPDALCPVKSIRGAPNEPYAVETALGWSIQGKVGAASTHETTAATMTTTVLPNPIERQLESLHAIDVQGIHDFSQKGPSQEDQEWERIVQGSITRSEPASSAKGQYTVELPFQKGSETIIPNNWSQAVQRLNSIKRKFVGNPQLERDYYEFMNKMINNNYMEKVQGPEPKSASYVLHHGVYHPRKPGKIRVVFNCAAKFKGVALNDCLLSGPDLTSSLLGVLLRFRQEAVAFMADVDAMFYNVLVPEHQRDAIRLLWFGQDKRSIEVYRLRVHLFGATSSPSVANFTLRYAAREAQRAGLVSEKAARTIESNFYVDDCLKSAPTVQEAIDLAREVSTACGYGGFNLSKFVSNSAALLRNVQPDRLSKEVLSVDLSQTETVDIQERALGVVWRVKEDEFAFRVRDKLAERCITRRQVLSTLSSLYDPLGVAAPVLLRARLIFHALTSAGNIDWDEQLDVETSELGRKWLQWVNGLKDIEQVRTARCFRAQRLANSKDWHLHVFCDASQEAYAAVVYLKQECLSQSNVAFVLGKARVAPSKTATIPRLELMAAKLGAELAATVQKELEYNIGERTFWSDSETVLKYLHNRTKRFHTFVANRISAILALTRVEEWRYVCTRDNPADGATRGLEAAELQESMWLRGPPFLCGDSTKYNQSKPDLKLQQDDPELKREQTVCVTREKESQNFMRTLLERCSTLQRTRRAIAVWIRFKEHLRTPKEQQMRPRPFTWSELQRAEKECIRWVQEEEFNVELRKGPEESALKVTRQSPLFHLSPSMYDGLICVNSRVRPKMLPIIPKGRLATLITEEAHCQQLHFGRQSTMTHVMSRYWIIGLNATARRIIRNCSECQRRKARPHNQQMAPLPDFRITPTSRAFEHTGVDYFGPFYIKKAQKEKSEEKENETRSKAYGVIFTCAVTRAVHLEIAEDLTSAEFINVFRRFVARRGNVARLISDNGLNFSGANQELDRELDKVLKRFISSPDIQKEMRDRRVEWSFNPPGASHFGGFWERLIRSIRQALSSLVAKAQLSFSALQTLMCECEAVLNNRPITIVSEDCQDPEPLTPNHLLLSRGSDFRPTQPPPGEYNRVAAAVRHHWKRVQHLAATFWKRWIKEYRVLLQHRRKWHREAKRELQVNNVVLVVDPIRARQYWKLGRVMQIYPSPRDGKIRAVEVRTAQGTVTRPITKLCLLEAASGLVHE